jgi:hypothetical protein
MYCFGTVPGENDHVKTAYSSPGIPSSTAAGFPPPLWETVFFYLGYLNLELLILHYSPEILLSHKFSNQFSPSFHLTGLFMFRRLKGAMRCAC